MCAFELCVDLLLPLLFCRFTCAGKVVAVIEPSRKREAVVGVLLPVETALAAPPPQGANPGPVATAAAAAVSAGTYQGCLMLFPLDPRLPKCIIGADSVATLPQELKCVHCSELLSCQQSMWL